MLGGAVEGGAGVKSFASSHLRAASGNRQQLVSSKQASTASAVRRAFVAMAFAVVHAVGSATATRLAWVAIRRTRTLRIPPLYNAAARSLERVRLFAGRAADSIESSARAHFVRLRLSGTVSQARPTNA